MASWCGTEECGSEGVGDSSRSSVSGVRAKSACWLLLWNLRRIHLDGSGSPRNAKGGLRTELHASVPRPYTGIPTNGSRRLFFRPAPPGWHAGGNGLHPSSNRPARETRSRGSSSADNATTRTRRHRTGLARGGPRAGTRQPEAGPVRGRPTLGEGAARRGVPTFAETSERVLEQKGWRLARPAVRGKLDPQPEVIDTAKCAGDPRIHWSFTASRHHRRTR